MTVVQGGSKCNLITGYTEGEDNQVAYGRHRYLAQTFTLDELNVIFRCRLKSWTVSAGHFYHYALRGTDGTGKPLAIDIAHTTLAPINESSRSPGKWRRFDFMDFPNLPAGVYALVVSIPTTVLNNAVRLRCDKTDSPFPTGKAWESNDDGNTWTEIPGVDFMFEIWGWPPPPVTTPPPVIGNWAPLTIEEPEVPENHTIIITTDIPVHLFMRWTDKMPLKHPLTEYRRGIMVPLGTRYCFVAWHENEQEEPGDTLIHTFIKPGWKVCETRWFYFIGTKQAEEMPSASPIFEFHRKGVEMYVISLGKFGEAEVLHGEVKLKEGIGVTITRDDPDNALEIAAAAAAAFLDLTDTPDSYASKPGHLVGVNVAENALEFVDRRGFGNEWRKFDPSGQLLSSLRWEYDELRFAVNGVGIDMRLYSGPMRSWGFRRPVACELRRARGPDAAGNPIVYSAIVRTTADIRNNMNQPCVGFMTGSNGQVSCFNGDGTGFKKTDFAWGIEPPLWLKWVISDTDIKFYGNNTLIATHTTYRPLDTKDLFFAIQAYGTSAFPRTVYMTRPHYSAD